MAAAVTLTKKGSTTVGSQYGPAAATDLLIEAVHVVTAATGDWIECGGASPQTQLVRQPLAAFFSPTDAVAAAVQSGADGAGVYATISGTKVVITCAGTIAAADFDVLIIGHG